MPAKESEMEQRPLTATIETGSSGDDSAHEDCLSDEFSSHAPLVQSEWIPWLALFLVSVTELGSYYMYFAVSSNEVPIKDDLHVGNASLSSLFSLYSLPNIFLVLVGGALSDIYGPGVVLLVSSSVAFAGSSCVALGAELKSFDLMAFGMFLIGLGSECLDNASAAIAITWFGKANDGKRIGFALGVVLFSQNLGSTLAFGLNGQFIQFFENYKAVLWTAAVCGFLGASTAFVYHRIEKKCVYIPPFRGRNACFAAFDFRAAKTFPSLYWLATAALISYGLPQDLMLGWGTDLLQDRKYSVEEAQTTVAIMTVIALLLSAPIGAVFDKTGGRPLGACVAVGSVAISFVVLSFMASGGAWMLMAAAVLFTVANSTLQPWYSLILPPRYIGLGIGIGDAVGNLGLTLGFPLLGCLQDTVGPRAIPVFLAALFLLSLCLIALWWFVTATAPARGELSHVVPASPNKAMLIDNAKSPRPVMEMFTVADTARTAPLPLPVHALSPTSRPFNTISPRAVSTQSPRSRPHAL